MSAGNSGQLVLVQVADAYYNEIYADLPLLYKSSKAGIAQSV
jgi:hypothetical protein